VWVRFSPPLQVVQHELLIAAAEKRDYSEGNPWLFFTDSRAGFVLVLMVLRLRKFLTLDIYLAFFPYVCCNKEYQEPISESNSLIVPVQ